MHRPSAIVVLLVVGLGCRDRDGEATATSPAPHGGPEHTIGVGLSPAWVPDADTPTFVTVRFTPREGTAVLDWTDASGTYSTSVDAEAGALRLLGVPAGSTVSWTLTVEGPEPASVGPFQAFVPAAPAPLRDWTVEATGDAEVRGQWLLLTQFHFLERSFAAVIDDAGRIRWWREAPPEHRILRLHVADAGDAFLWASNIADRSGEDGRIVREPFDGGPAITATAPRLHHDFVEHGDGYAFLAWVDQDMPLTAGGPVLPMTSDAIRVVEQDATGAYDDVFNYFDSWPAEVRRPCSHAVRGAFVPGRIEWTHSNSLVRANDGDGWWILPRFLDQVGRIHADGTVSHIVGGLAPTLVHPGEEVPFAHGHMSQVTDEGALLIFSNGEHVHMRDGSKVVELLPEPASGTVETIWTVPEPEERYVGYLGDAWRLPGGHTLVVSPDFGIYEVTPDGDVVWEAHQDPDAVWDYNVGRVEPIEPLPPYGP